MPRSIASCNVATYSGCLQRYSPISISTYARKMANILAPSQANRTFISLTPPGQGFRNSYTLCEIVMVISAAGSNTASFTTPLVLTEMCPNPHQRNDLYDYCGGLVWKINTVLIVTVVRRRTMSGWKGVTFNGPHPIGTFTLKVSRLVARIAHHKRL